MGFSQNQSRIFLIYYKSQPYTMHENNKFSVYVIIQKVLTVESRIIPLLLDYIFVYFVGTWNFYLMFLFYYFLCMEIENFQNILIYYLIEIFIFSSFFTTDVNIFLNLLI